MSTYSVRAIKRFRPPPGSDSTFSFNVDDIVQVSEVVDDGDYLKGLKDGVEGFFPADSVERITESEAIVDSEEKVEVESPILAPVSVPASVVAPSIPETTPIPPPPPPPTPAVAPTPSSPPATPKKLSLKEKIAALNAAGAGAAPPPPALKPKPAAARKWAIPSASPQKSEPIPSSSTTAALPLSFTATPSLPPTTSSTSPEKLGKLGDREGGMFSAADAQAAVSKGGGSLKERIAALQGLKLDTPSEPGRAPKVWKKKEVEIPVSDAVEGDPATADSTVEESKTDKEGEEKVKPTLPSLETNSLSTPNSIPLPPSATSPFPPSSSSPVPPLSAASDNSISSNQSGPVIMPAIPKRAGPPKRRAPVPVTLPVEAPAVDSVEVVEPTSEEKMVDSKVEEAPEVESVPEKAIELEEKSEQVKGEEQPEEIPAEEESTPTEVSPTSASIAVIASAAPDTPVAQDSTGATSSKSVPTSSRPPIPANFVREVVEPFKVAETRPVSVLVSEPEEEKEEEEKAEENNIEVTSTPKRDSLPPPIPVAHSPAVEPTSQPLVEEPIESEDQEEETEQPKEAKELVEENRELDQAAEEEVEEEEDPEIARRAALAARMAKLGGTRMGGLMFAPAPVPRAKKASVEQVETEVPTIEKAAQAPRAPQFRLPSIPTPKIETREVETVEAESIPPPLPTGRPSNPSIKAATPVQEPIASIEEPEEEVEAEEEEEFDVVESEEGEEQFENSTLHESEEFHSEIEEEEEEEESAPILPPRSHPAASPPPSSRLPTLPSHESVFDGLPPPPRSLPPVGGLPSLPSPTLVATAPGLERTESNFSILDVDIPSSSFSFDESTTSTTNEPAPVEVVASSSKSYTLQELIKFSSLLGAQLFAAAHSIEKKLTLMSEEEFISFCFSKTSNALLPNFNSYGSLIHSLIYDSPTKKLLENKPVDEIRIGDLITFFDCKFKQNLGTMRVGNLVGVVSGWDEKKRKVHYYWVEKGGVVEGAKRVDELRGGKIEIWRAVLV